MVVIATTAIITAHYCQAPIPNPLKLFDLEPLSANVAQ